MKPLPNLKLCADIWYVCCFHPIVCLTGFCDARAMFYINDIHFNNCMHSLCFDCIHSISPLDAILELCAVGEPNLT